MNLDYDIFACIENSTRDLRGPDRTCPDCGGPLHLVQGGTEDGPAWYHESNAALMACPFTRRAS